MKSFLIVLLFLLQTLGVKAQITDSIWSGDYNGINYDDHYRDVRRSVNFCIDSLETTDSLFVK